MDFSPPICESRYYHTAMVPTTYKRKKLWKIPVGDAGIDQWPLYKAGWKKIFSFFIGNKKDPTQICICQSWKKKKLSGGHLLPRRLTCKINCPCWQFTEVWKCWPDQKTNFFVELKWNKIHNNKIYKLIYFNNQ
mgnify:CR=1 FL=1